MLWSLNQPTTLFLDPLSNKEQTERDFYLSEICWDPVTAPREGRCLLSQIPVLMYGASAEAMKCLGVETKCELKRFPTLQWSAG